MLLTAACVPFGHGGRLPEDKCRAEAPQGRSAEVPQGRSTEPTHGLT